ncbi:MAG: DUF302 domain-containing protein [Pseudonocardiaceae bacterium]
MAFGLSRRMRRWMIVNVLLVLGIAACGETPSQTAPPASVDTPGAATQRALPQIEGLVAYVSRYDVAETVRRLSDGLSAAGGVVAATVDHAANARSAGAELAPTTVIVGGVPRAGTPLIAARQQAGVLLPQKYLVWQDEAGTVRLAYNAADYLTQVVDADAAAGQLLAEGSARLAAAATGTERPSSTGPAPSGGDYLITLSSDADPATTLRRLQEAVAAKGLTPAAVVDHAKAAATIGTTLRPTTVLLVGNPAAGTPLIQANQSMGIDLPLRFLIWQGEDGTTRVSYPDITRLAQRHGIPSGSQPVTMVSNGAAAFASAAAGQPG